MGAVSNAVDRRNAADNQGATGKAVAPSEQNITAFVRTVAEARGTFGRLLPPHLDAETFVGIAAGALWKNQDLAAAALTNPQSFFIALRDCARLGHQPGTDQYALTVRKVNGRPSVLGIEQYQGVIERMFRAGAVQSVQAEVVCKGEVFRPNGHQTPTHQVPNDDWFSRNLAVDNLIGVYAYAILEGGVCSRVIKMGRDDVMKHRAVAATHNIWDGPFGQSMWLKTACHELEKWVPTSAEYKREQARAAAVLADAMQQRPAPPPAAPAHEEASTVDGAVVDPPAQGGDEWPDAAKPGGGA